jgi:hypothetical protein
MKKLKQFMLESACLLCLVGTIKVLGQGVVFFNTLTTMYVIPTNSTTLITGFPNTNPNQPGGTGRTHYVLIENRWTNDVVFDFALQVATTNVTINGGTTNLYVGHLLRPLDTYEIPADKEYNGPIAATTSNGSQGVLAITTAMNVN